MSDVRELNERRQELATRLAALITERDHAFRANSDALALQRAGITHHNDSEMNTYATDEISGDSAITDLRRQIELIDDELSRGGGGIGRRSRRLVQRLRK